MVLATADKLMLITKAESETGLVGASLSMSQAEAPVPITTNTGGRSCADTTGQSRVLLAKLQLQNVTLYVERCVHTHHIQTRLMPF